MIMNKYQKYRTAKKKDFQSIAALQSHLFSELDSIQQNSPSVYTSDHFFTEFYET
jgi:hypothetical protein